MTTTRHETKLDKVDIWSALAAPLQQEAIQWRQDGRVIARDGRFLARFVAFVEANTVRERLDSVVPGEWAITLDPLPPVAGLDDDANQGACSFKCRLEILGVTREDVGTGKDYKQAATDAFKRAAVRYGIGHELYAYEQNWVQMDGDGKFARPIEDPAVAYQRRYGRSSGANGVGARGSATATQPEAPQQAAPTSAPADGTPESVLMPFGKHKGTALGELDEGELLRTITWATGANPTKFAALIADCQAVINRRAVAAAP